MEEGELRSSLTLVFRLLDTSGIRNCILVSRTWRNVFYETSGLWRRIHLDGTTQKQGDDTVLSDWLIVMSKAPYLKHFLQDLTFDCPDEVSYEMLEDLQGLSFALLLISAALKTLFPNLASVTKTKPDPTFRSFVLLSLQPPRIRLPNEKRDTSSDNLSRVESGGCNSFADISEIWINHSNVQLFNLIDRWALSAVCFHLRNHYENAEQMLDVLQKKGAKKGDYIKYISSMQDVMPQIIQEGYRVSFENPLFRRFSMQHHVLLNRMMYHIIDKLISALIKSRNPSGFIFSASIVRQAILDLLHPDLHPSFQTPDASIIGTTTRDLICINKIRWIIQAHGIQATHDAIANIVHFFKLVLTLLRDGPAARIIGERRSSHYFLSLIKNSMIDNLLWDLPLENTSWELWDRSKSTRSAHFNLKKGSYTMKQQLMIEEENSYRKLFQNCKRWTENFQVDFKLKDPHVNLVKVYDTFDMFDIQSLDRDEMMLPMILKKYRASDDVSSHDVSSHDVSSNDIASNDVTMASRKSSIVDKNQFSENIAKYLGLLAVVDWSNLFVAGGAVLGSLLGNHEKFLSSDVDVFFYGLDPAAAVIKLRSILLLFSQQDAMIVVTSQHCVSVSFGFPARTLQFILRCYLSPSEILHGFDVDCCAVGFDGKDVWASQRCVRALTKRYNLVNITRRSPTYELRLFKYAKKRIWSHDTRSGWIENRSHAVYEIKHEGERSGQVVAMGL
eukprot:TRINITY_DN4742_c0_g2_i4.p1 TRINITY_DN4742_c0_g2~~TRINITY_DN4742_c0_g2_i4.p1  ORF type:complete len:741 (+),score=183.91 TRINITY_DN4742_c0_g2_i4:38-2224(+)